MIFLPFLTSSKSTLKKIKKIAIFFFIIQKKNKKLSIFFFQKHKYLFETCSASSKRQGINSNLSLSQVFILK